ncbi:hypothetical protein ANCDUO_22693 [Ancylostoma duodenale]|uniref:Uncharacterized protein n=1 Tax=Ancylostoma duodenale TaxID=51022 RepID=A0A0C2FKF5_9BILA|nr:hypothetical protein ANCDUO_22693 [Ancylostoma duodenale]
MGYRRTAAIYGFKGHLVPQTKLMTFHLHLNANNPLIKGVRFTENRQPSPGFIPMLPFQHNSGPKSEICAGFDELGLIYRGGKGPGVGHDFEMLKAALTDTTLYGAECWPATKEVERRLGVMEMKMLR